MIQGRIDLSIHSLVFYLMSVDIPAFLKAFANFKRLNPNPEIRPRGQLTLAVIVIRMTMHFHKMI